MEKHNLLKLIKLEETDSFNGMKDIKEDDFKNKKKK